MKKTYTKDEMTALWRGRAGLEPAVTSCGITRHDGVDVDTAIGQRARQWYLDLLYRGDRRYLALEDISPRVSFSTDGYNIGRCALPLDVCRVFEVRLAGWASSARVARRPPARLLSLLAHPDCRGSMTVPAAWLENDILCVAPAAEARGALIQPLMITAAVDPGPQSFIIDDSALSTIPVFDPFDR